jgi:hypothetical protein
VKPPERRTFEQFLADAREWEDEHVTYSDGVLICIQCRSRILERTAYLSIHDSPFGNCGGRGQVLKVSLPFCPECEAPPELYGCLHVGQR